MLLRRVFRDAFVLCPSLLIFAAPLIFARPAAAQTKRIAVYDFDYKACRNDVIQVYGMDKNVGAQAAQRLLSRLVGKGDIQVIDRSQIDRILKEQNQKFSDRFDPADAPKFGKLLNVDAIVTGSVDALVDEVQNNRVGVGPVGLGKVEAVAEVTLSVRVISTQTAQIFMADQVNNKQKHSLGKGAKVGKNGGGDTSASAHPGAIAATLAIQGAADTIAAELLEKADALPVRSSSATASSKGSPAPDRGAAMPAPGGPSTLTVGKVDGSRVYVTGGENAGIKLGDSFEVRRVTGTMKDAAGNDIETDERIEIIVVTDVQDKFSVAKASSGTTVAKAGDRLKKMKAPAAAPPKKSPTPAATPGTPAATPRKQ